MNTPVLFPFNEDLDLSNFVTTSEASTEDDEADSDSIEPLKEVEQTKVPFTMNYRLCGVVNHTGVCGGGHYTAYAKCADGNWRKFNDKFVTVINKVPENLETDAYLLFFERV